MLSTKFEASSLAGIEMKSFLSKSTNVIYIAIMGVMFERKGNTSVLAQEANCKKGLDAAWDGIGN